MPYPYEFSLLSHDVHTVYCAREWHLRGMQVEMEVIRVQLELMERHSVQGAVDDYY